MPWGVWGFMLLASAHAEDAPPDRYALRRRGIADGLPQSSVTGLVAARDGYLWLTSFGGIARFDGVRFEVFDQVSDPALPTNRYVGLAEDPSGTLWFATEDQGLVRRRDGVFALVAPSTGAWSAAPAGIVVDGAGVVWAVVSGDLVRVEGDRITPVPEARAAAGGPFRLQRDDTGGVWLERDAGVLCWEGPCRTDRTLRPPPGPTWADAALHVPGGVSYLAGWSPHPACTSVATPPPDHAWLRLLDWAGRIWCGGGASVHSGPVRFDLTGGTEDHLAPAEISTAARDREGSLWLGTIGGGLAQLRDLGIERWGEAQGLAPTSGLALAEDRTGRVWISTEHGVSMVRGDTRVPVPGGLDGLDHIRALTTDAAGAVWIVTNSGFLRYADDRLEPVQLDLDPFGVDAILVDEDGAVWIGGEDGLSRCGGSAPPAHWPREVLGGRVAVIRRLGDAVWVGAGNAALRMDGGQPRRFTGPNAAPVRDLVGASDGLGVWAGTYGGGLLRIREDGVTSLGIADGLCEAVASRLLPTTDGSLWINGNRGVSRIRLADIEARAVGGPPVTCERLDTGEGNGNGGLLASDGSLWLPTVGGAARVLPDEVPSLEPPRVVIEAVHVNGAAVPPGAERIVGPGELNVRFTAMGLADPGGVRVEHRLVGLEEEWRASDERTAHYTHLPPGTYRFEVRARGAWGAWGEPVGVDLRLRPDWFETPWFRGGAVLLVGVSVGSLAWARARANRRHTATLEAEIGERRRIELELREREAHYRTLFQRTTDGLFLHEANGALIEVNPAGAAMIGSLPPPDPPLPYVDPASRETVMELIRRTVSGDTVGAVEATLLGPRGRLEVVMQAAQLDHHGVFRVILSARDVTAERRAARDREHLEGELQQARKLEALGQLAGGIAHDFNNLLTVVRVHATLLADAVTPDQKEDVEAISEAVERARGMTSKLLVFARRQPAQVQLVDVRAQVESTLSVLRRTIPEDVVISLHNHEMPLIVDVDPVRLEQVVMNLVLNARDALPHGGTIQVRTELKLVKAAESERHTVSQGFYACVEVRDDGVGIPEDVLPRVFDPFFTTKEPGKGTGMGLATVHGAVTEAHGYVTVHSTPGSGTTLRVHLPLSGSVPSPTRLPTPARTSTARGQARVLVCDDEPAVLAVMARVLRSAGFDVVAAATPEAAIAQAEGAQILVSDVVMPGMNGPALAEAVKRVTGPIPVLFVSGHTRDLLHERGIPTGSDLLWKPFRPDELVLRVAALLG